MKKFLIFVLFIFMLLNVSCTKKTTAPLQEQETPPKEEPEEIIGIEDSELEKEDENKVISPLDGLKYYPEELNKRPVAISLDNHPKARWQAGLKDAEIVYEFEVEFPYTRYLAVFLAKEPERIGPIRSARPYIIYYALENDALFVHVGGSNDAFTESRRLMVSDIDGLYSSAMWRYNDTGKFAPHNMYTTLKSIRNEAIKRGFVSTEGDFEKYEFNEKQTKLSEKYDISTAKKINITYNKDNTSDYVYDEESKLYLRFKDKEKHVDELDKAQLKTKNIIVLEAQSRVLDNAGRLYMETIGSGKGIYFTEGESVNITWKKDTEGDRTKFYVNNEILKLNPGNTWIQIVDSLNIVTSE